MPRCLYRPDTVLVVIPTPTLCPSGYTDPPCSSLATCIPTPTLCLTGYTDSHPCLSCYTNLHKCLCHCTITALSSVDIATFILFLVVIMTITRGTGAIMTPNLCLSGYTDSQKCLVTIPTPTICLSGNTEPQPCHSSYTDRHSCLNSYTNPHS